jgi:NAD-dependent DNA ligase
MAYEGANAAVRACLDRRELVKAAQVLNGICAGIAADNTINDQEIQYLKIWLRDHREVAETWPGYVLADRIRAVLADGVITQDERDDILKTLKQLSGNRFTETGAAKTDGPMLPLDDDPSIYFRNMTFCFTGGFIYGTRADCERIVLSLGSMPVDRVSKKLNYLIIGTFVEPSWVNTSYGRKIETAARHRDNGVEICIASEYQWTAAIKDATRQAKIGPE